MRQHLDRAAGWPRRPVWNTAARWLLKNLQAEIVRLTLPRATCLHVCYESLMASPSEELARIGQFLSLDYTAVAHRLHAGEKLPVGCDIGGNRLHLHGPVNIQADTQWVENMPLRQQRLSKLIASPLLRRYGYRWSQPLSARRVRRWGWCWGRVVVQRTLSVSLSSVAYDNRQHRGDR